MTHRILLVDATGRGHALCDLFIRTNPLVEVVYAPGCPALDHPRVQVRPRARLDQPDDFVALARAEGVEFAFVSHIDALTAGAADALRAAGIPTIGPSRAAARLEESKAFGKAFCARHGLPTPPARSFRSMAAAKRFVVAAGHPVVVKDDGLRAFGDGAMVCGDAPEACRAIDTIAAHAREQGRDPVVVVERRLFGTEVSVFALLDATGWVPFPPALDYKRHGEGNTGKNCDGMGSLGPHPLDGPALRRAIERDLIGPLHAGLRRDGLAFTGFVYVGAMLADNRLNVLEINVRFGDSEAEVVLPSVHADFHRLCHRVLENRVSGADLPTDGFVRCSVAAVQGPTSAGGLPGWPHGAFARGVPIEGLASRERDPAAQVFLAGVSRDADGQPRTRDGRVLHAVGRGATPAVAASVAYDALAAIRFDGMHRRSDIGGDWPQAFSRRRPWIWAVPWLRVMAASTPGGACKDAAGPAGVAADLPPLRRRLVDSVLAAAIVGERPARDAAVLAEALGARVTEETVGAFEDFVAAARPRVAALAGGRVAGRDPGAVVDPPPAARYRRLTVSHHCQRSPAMSQTDTLDLLCTEVRRILSLDEIEATMAFEDLGFDSLNVVELILACEQIYGAIDIGQLRLEKFTTLAQLDQQVLGLAAEARAAAGA